MNCNTTHYRANSSSVPGDPTFLPLTLFALWGLIGAALWRVRRLPAGVPVRELENGAVLRVPADTPVQTGFGFALIPGVLSFVGWMALSSGNGHPFLVPWQVAAAAGVVAIAALIGWSWKSWRVWAGRYDVVIDDAARTVSVPRGPEKSGAATLSFDSVVCLIVQVSKGDIPGPVGSLPLYSYIPTIEYCTSCGTFERAKLVRWSDEGKAHALARWLRQRLSAGDTDADAAARGYGK